MARKRVDILLSNFIGVNVDEFVGPIRRGVQSFVDFMDSDSIMWEHYEFGSKDAHVHHLDSYWQTSAGYQAHTNDVLTAKCLLDYVYLWLAQGPAGLHCPTYESYLMSIIAIIDEYLIYDEDDDNQQGWLRYIRQDHGKHFYVFYWGTKASAESKARDKSMSRQSEVPDYYYPGVDAANTFENVPLDVENYDHPALRRDAYEFYQRRVRAEEADKKLRDMLRAVIAPKE